MPESPQLLNTEQCCKEDLLGLCESNKATAGYYHVTKPSARTNRLCRFLLSTGTGLSFTEVHSPVESLEVFVNLSEDSLTYPYGVAIMDTAVSAVFPCIPFVC